MCLDSTKQCLKSRLFHLKTWVLYFVCSIFRHFFVPRSRLAGVLIANNVTAIFVICTERTRNFGGWSLNSLTLLKCSILLQNVPWMRTVLFDFVVESRAMPDLTSAVSSNPKDAILQKGAGQMPQLVHSFLSKTAMARSRKSY